MSSKLRRYPRALSMADGEPRLSTRDRRFRASAWVAGHPARPSRDGMTTAANSHDEPAQWQRPAPPGERVVRYLDRAGPLPHRQLRRPRSALTFRIPRPVSTSRSPGRFTSSRTTVAVSVSHGPKAARAGARRRPCPGAWAGGPSTTRRSTSSCISVRAERAYQGGSPSNGACMTRARSTGDTRRSMSVTKRPIARHARRPRWWHRHRAAAAGGPEPPC
jgi:hypothetical protein